MKQIVTPILIGFLAVQGLLNANELSNLTKDELYRGIRSKTAKMTAMKRKLVKTDKQAMDIQSSLNEIRAKELVLEAELLEALLKHDDYKKLKVEQEAYRNQLKTLKSEKK